MYINPKKEYSFKLEDFKKVITEVTLTKDNIFDYIDIVEESEEVYYEDINQTHTETAITHRPKQDQLLVFETVVTYDFSDYTDGLIEANDFLDTKEMRCGFTTYPSIAFKLFNHEDSRDLG